MSTIINATTPSPELDEIRQNAPTWAVIVGDFAPIINICLRLSPIPTVIRFVAKRTTGSLPLMPYTALLSDSLLWLFYGVLTNDVLLIVTHACNSALASVYTAAYSFVHNRSAPDPPDLTVLPGRLRHHLSFVGLVVAGSAAVTLLHSSQKRAEEVLGLCADLGSLSMYASPLTALRAVLREQDASSVPLPYTTACLLNGFSWFVYGWVVADEIVIWAPSAVGLLLASAQLALILRYGQKGANTRDQEPTTGGGFELKRMVDGEKKKKTKRRTGDDDDGDAREDFHRDADSANGGSYDDDDDVESWLDDDDSCLDFVEDVEDDAEFDSFLNEK